jgi:hypothetical protein
MPSSTCLKAAARGGFCPENSRRGRMSKDYERLSATGEAFVYTAMTRLMVRRLARV